jgi:opacity protein-like surface antigen
MTPRSAGSLVALLVLALGAWPVRAQEPAPPSPPAEQERPDDPRPAPEERPADDSQPDDRDAPARRGHGTTITPRVTGLVGIQSFTATESFDAILGTSSGVVYGGSAGVLIGRNIFVDVQVTRWRAEGSRVFISEQGERFDLDIPTTVTVTPIDVSAGWRFAGEPRLGASGKPRFRLVPFAGAGVGVQRYRETSEFADSQDDVDESHGSYHVLGGVELPFTPHLGAQVDVLYRWVPDGIGSSGVSDYFDETDLGGAQIRFRVAYTF